MKTTTYSLCLVRVELDDVESMEGDAVPVVDNLGMMTLRQDQSIANGDEFIY